MGNDCAVVVLFDDDVEHARAALRFHRTFVVIRNLGPIVTLGIESTVHPDSQLACDLPTVLSLFSIVLGVIVYEGVDVLTSVPSSPGIALLLLNLACTCGERMVQRHLLAVQTVDVSKPGLMLINNSVGMILVACATPLRPGEVTRTLHALSKWPSPGLHVLLSALVGSAISYFGLKLQKLVTATSFMVLGAGCKMLLILIGIVAFGDLSRPGAVLGGLASLLGCIAYAQIQRAASSSNAPIKGPAPLPWSLFVTYAVVMTAMIASITDPAVSAEQLARVA